MSRKIVVGMLALALLSFGATPAKGPGDAGQFKLVHFPEQTSLGILYMHSPKVPLVEELRNITRYKSVGEAKGTIRVPKGTKLLLMAGYGAAHNPSLLAALDPDCFFGMTFNFVETDDKTAASLKGLTGLRGLDIGQSDLTDEGMKSLSNLKNLEYLGICFAQISDLGMKSLIPLSSLAYLDMARTRVGDEGMKYLAQVKHLRVLTAGGCQFTDEGLKSIAKLSDLYQVQLCDNSKITARGLLYLAPLKKLNYLNIRDTAVTARDLPLMQQLSGRIPALHTIVVCDKSFTAAQVEKWKRAMPRVLTAYQTGK